MSCLSLAAVALLLCGYCLAGPAIAPAYPGVIPVQQLLPKPYEFGFEFGDGLGMLQHRREVGDGTGAVRGSYGYLDPLGVRRVVEYTAGDLGYKAVIRTNEPGVGAQNAADALFFVQPPPPAAVAQGLRAGQAKLLF